MEISLSTNNRLTLEDLSRLLDKNYWSVKKACQRGRFETAEKVKGRLTIDITDPAIPPEARAKYYNMNNPAAVTDISAFSDVEVDALLYAKAPEYNRKRFDKYIQILTACEGLSGKQLKIFVNSWNEHNPALRTSYPRILDARKIVEKEGKAGLLGNYGKKAGRTIIPDLDYEYFKTLYLKPGRPTLETCWLSTMGDAVKRNGGVIIEDYPCAKSFLNRLEKEVSESAIYLARYGHHNWNKKYASYINRDYANILPGQVWISDHKQVDQAVMRSLPKQMQDEILLLLEMFDNNEGKKKAINKPAFPWLTVWRDFLTGKWLGWCIHIEDPNSDHIFQAFYNAADVFGIPEELILDNGKDYRCKDFSGRKRNVKIIVDENKTRSLCGMLDITVHFALPYNAQAKPIERDFKNWKDWIDKPNPGYRGGNHVERPEILQDNIKSGRILSYNDFYKLMEYAIIHIVNKFRSYGKNLLGKSRDEAWAEANPHLKRVSSDALKLFCMRTSNDLTIGRNGITVSNKYDLYYWADWMYNLKGTKVYMRRDNKKYQEAWVYDSSTDEYLGIAYLNAWVCNALVKTDLERQQLENLMRAKRNEEKIIKKYIEPGTSITPKDYLENLAIGITATSNMPEEMANEPGVPVFIKTKMDEDILINKVKKTGTDNIDWDNINPGKNKKEEPKDWF
jgi:hypothetical protein